MYPEVGKTFPYLTRPHDFGVIDFLFSFARLQETDTMHIVHGNLDLVSKDLNLFPRPAT